MAEFRAENVRRIQSVVAPIAKRYGIKSVSLFGSQARGTATDMSDVDLKIDPGRMKGLFALSGFRLDVEEALGRRVDVITTRCPNARLMREVARDEALLYLESADKEEEP